LKKAFWCLALLVFSFAAFAAPVRIIDMRSEAQGGLGMADSLGALSFYHNPASLVFRESDSPFGLTATGLDSIDPEAFAAGDPNPLLCDPAVSGNVRFVGSNAALSITMTNLLYEKSISEDGSYGTYDALTAADLQLTAAYGWKNFAFGFTVNGGNCTERRNISIYDRSTFLDYIMETLFERYHTKLGSEFVSLSLGTMAKFGNFSFGLTFDELTKMNDGQSISFSLGAMMMTMNAGIHYSGSRYDSRTAGLLFVVPSFGIEVHNAFLDSSDDVVLPAASVKSRQSELCIGTEIRLQFAPDLSVSLLAGWRSGSFAGGFFGSSCQTFGLGMDTDVFRADLAVKMPVSVYSGTKAKVTASMGLDFFI